MELRPCTENITRNLRYRSRVTTPLLLLVVMVQTLLGGRGILHVAANAVCPDLPTPVPLPGGFAADAGLAAALAQVDRMLQGNVSAVGIPGFVAAVVYDQDMVWFKGYGRVNFTDPTSGPPAMDSMLRIASITKVFTVLAALAARDDGKVSLDDPLVSHLPGFSVLSPYRTRKSITLRQLASHTSGLPREVPYPCSFSTVGACNQTKVLPAVPPKTVTSL